MKKRESIDEVLKEIGSLARKQAFRRNYPVAISENGEAVLLYPDGTRKKITDQVLKELASNVRP